MKKIFIDIETTGLSSYGHSIVQLNALVNIEGSADSILTLSIKPHPSAWISPEALKIINKTKEQLRENEYTQDEAFGVWRKFLRQYVNPYKKADKFHFIAYNTIFTWPFIRQWFRKQRDNYFHAWFWWPPSDIAILYADMLKTCRPHLSNMKLNTLMEFIGLSATDEELSDPHTRLRFLKHLYDLYQLRYTNLLPYDPPE